VLQNKSSKRWNRYKRTALFSEQASHSFPICLKLELQVYTSMPYVSDQDQYFNDGQGTRPSRSVLIVVGDYSGAVPTANDYDDGNGDPSMYQDAVQQMHEPDGEDLDSEDLKTTYQQVYQKPAPDYPLTSKHVGKAAAIHSLKHSVTNEPSNF